MWKRYGCEKRAENENVWKVSEKTHWRKKKPTKSERTGDGPRPTTIGNYCSSGSERTAVPSTTIPSSMDPTILFFLPFFVRAANNVKHCVFPPSHVRVRACMYWCVCVCVVCLWSPLPPVCHTFIYVRISDTKKDPGSYNFIVLLFIYL